MTWEKIQTLSGHSDVICDFTYSPASDLLASGRKDGVVLRLWSTETGKRLSAPLRYENSISNVEFSPKRDLILSSSTDGLVYFWNVETRKCFRTLARHTDDFGQIRTNLISPAGEQIISSDNTGKVCVLDWKIDDPRHALSGLNERIA